MLWYQIFQDGPEYEARKKMSTFTPPNLTLKDVHDAVPKHLFKRDTLKSSLYVVQHLLLSYTLFVFATRIDYLVNTLSTGGLQAFNRVLLIPLLWFFYWGMQGILFAGIWCLGHEAGHETLSPYPLVNAVIGIILHTFVLVPYYAWRSTHRTHHKSTNDLDRDETYIPPTRRDLKLPDGQVAVRMDYEDVLEDSPAFTLFKMFMRQFFGFQLYLFHNRKGNPKYPPGTSHYKPSSPLFKPEQRRSIIVSNVAISAMLVTLAICVYQKSFSAVSKYYLIPWLFANNWIVTFTYLQHSDPTIPYYRKGQWTFARGALATVDRPLFGWIGQYLLCNISHHHIAHHLFSTVPFYNLPQVTEAIKPVLGEYYNYDTTNIFYALWRSFTQCRFVETEGDIVFFKNAHGEAVLEPQVEAL